jgi:hypothetical protein
MSYTRGEGRYDTDAILSQIAVTMRAIATELALPSDEAPGTAYTRAYYSGRRKAETNTDDRSLAHMADLFVHWLTERVRIDDEPLQATFSIALAAAEDPEGDSQLARDLLEYVTGYCDGSISDDESYRRLKKPRSGMRRRKPRPQPIPEGAITAGAAERTLREMLGLTEASQTTLDPRTSWDVFKEFAGLPAVAEPPNRLQSDDLLFQWDNASVDFTRQFSIEDSDGDYDRMEQLHVTFWFEGSDGPEPGNLWSAVGSLEVWTTQVEQTPGFAFLVSGLRPARVTVEQERV